MSGGGISVSGSRWALLIEEEGLIPFSSDMLHKHVKKHQADIIRGECVTKELSNHRLGPDEGQPFLLLEFPLPSFLSRWDFSVMSGAVHSSQMEADLRSA